ncbi:hypothetical protein Y1Q_0009613 [Alligator mississippiensis]|uniref:Uncharacterized protein n=1 Tax=Alligator mississippiensis TaxID=8496 RepID=A0A151NVI9_ALLMI|nr:hypothetical protein Y1Q_0009613 [Alligator mississippiensis]
MPQATTRMEPASTEQRCYIAGGKCCTFLATEDFSLEKNRSSRRRGNPSFLSSLPSHIKKENPLVPKHHHVDKYRCLSSERNHR